MDLRIGRSYLREEREWEFGIQGVPTRVVYPDGLSGICCNPVFFTADGGKHTAYPIGGGVYMTTEFWRYTPSASARTLEMPNGWSVSFELGANAGGSMMTQVEDVFGNVISATWNGSTSPSNQRPLTLASVTQNLGPSQVRTITFEYNTAACPSGMPSKMIYGSRYWLYGCQYADAEAETGPRLTSVTPRIGTGWIYGYTGDRNTGKLKVTTPNGGWVEYEFEGRQLPSGAPLVRTRALVKRREVGGRDIASGVWTFAYLEDTPGMVATVTLPGTGNRRVIYKHAPTANDGWFFAGKEFWIGTGPGTLLSSLARTRTDIPFAGTTVVLAVPAVETTVYEGRTFTRTFEYNTGNFGDYGQAFRITETGDFTRVTTREFQDNFSPVWLANRISEVKVEVGSESFTDTWTRDTSTGFLESQTIRGIETTFAPDDFGNVGTITDGNTHETGFVYEWGVLKETTTAEGHITINTINSDGTVAIETRDGHATSFSYDHHGRLTGVDHPLGNDTITTYDNADGAWVKVARGPNWTKTLVDGFGRTEGTEDAAGVRTVTTYDAEGRTTYQSLPFTGSGSGTGDSFAYDAQSRIETVTHADGTVTSYAYSGAKVTTTDEFTDGVPDRVTEHTWQQTGSPDGGRLSSMKDADLQTWSYAYNALDAMTSVSEPGGSTRTWAYTTAGQLGSETHPASGTTSYTYDGVGAVHTRTDAKGQVFTYHYDDDNRLIEIDAPGTDHDVTQVFDDAAGNRKRVQTGPVGNRITTDFFYDDNDRLWKRVDTIQSRTFTTLFDYDARDNLEKITYPSGHAVRYGIDDADRVSDVYDLVGAGWAEDFTYHASGAVSGYTAANGAIASTTFDARHRPLALTSGWLSLTYAYWQSGNVKTITDGRGNDSSQAFGYDAVDRLTTATGMGAGTFGYDERGNRASKNGVLYGYTGVRMTSDGTTTYDHDSNGNVTKKGGTEFAPTPFNLPASVKTGGVTTEYRYDGDGERRMRTQGGVTTYFIPGVGYEPLAEYQEVGGVLTLVREYIYANGQLIASEAPVPSPVAPVTFTDDPLVAGTTMVKAVHITQLRTAINAARVVAGLTAATWTDTLTADTTVIKPVHVTELRTALSAVYTALGVTPPTFTDATLPVDTALIKAVHLQELRAAHATIAAATLTAKAYYHLDAIGSVRALTSSTGAELERHDYTAFGEELTSPTGLDTRRFGGKERDPETGLAYFAARYYAPETGRFAQADDPGFGNVFDPQSLNQYGYTSG
ncbi:MAG: RHS repeat-associated core domain-containing protein, partial [Acidobacteria bacterium]|nr:RHS repeat-associated core domain-containing protein [Acidobacteriota bacterium]